MTSRFAKFSTHILSLLVLTCALWHSNSFASTPLILGNTDTTKYGNGYEGTNTNPVSAEFVFNDSTSPIELSLTTYDIDEADEVSVLVNGVTIGNLSTTPNNGTGSSSLSISLAQQVSGTNTLSFKQKKPVYKWGIKNVLLTENLIPQLIIGTTHTQGYGFEYNNINTNKVSAEFEFQGSNTDLELSLDTFDIDISDEVSVLVNDVPVGFLAVTPNNGIGSSVIDISYAEQTSGTNTLSFRQKKPVYKWGIKNILLTGNSITQLIIGTTHTQGYGFEYNNINTNKVSAEFEFQGSNTDLELSMDTFDIDIADEVSVLINAVPVGFLAVTPNNGIGSSVINISSVDQISGTNTLSFKQKKSGYIWGIENILLTENSIPQLIIGTTHTQGYGFQYNNINTNRTSAEFEFQGSTTDLELSLDTFDIDIADEVSVLVNAAPVGFLAVTPNNGIGSSVINISSADQISGTNTLSFKQKKSGYVWGLKNILLSENSIATLPKISDYELVFNDEFSTSSLDPNKWNTGLLWGPYAAINAEEQLYVDILGMHQGYNHNPFELTGDSLIIRATPVGGAVQPPPRPAENNPIWDDYAEYQYNGPGDNGPGYDPANVNYLSGIITSNESFNLTHGYVESRLKLSKGKGLWPAFWALNKHYVEDSPEIDVVEFLGHDPNTVYHTYHYFEPQNDWAKISTPSYESNGPDWTLDFHTFGMAWSPKEIVWYVDGVEAKRITSAQYKMPKQSMYLLANLAVGGVWPGSPDSSTPFPAEYEIDYIRAYKRKLSPNLNLSADYQMMFNDEFNGNSLDTSKWNTSFLWGPYIAINNEEQYYVDSADTDQDVGYTPFDVSNGSLKIIADQSANSPPNVPPTTLPGINDPIWLDNPSFQRGPYPGAPDYTSGIITSYDSFKFVNGYAEIRAKVPLGDGLWPAFWLLNSYYVGLLPEIDIMEIVGESPHIGYHTFHRSSNNGVPLQDQFTSNHGSPSIGYSDDFHTFGVRWRPGVITWYVDGQVVDTYTESGDVNRAYQLMYVIANLAVGGNFNQEPTDPSVFPARYEIDYIRVYQEKDTP